MIACRQDWEGLDLDHDMKTYPEYKNSNVPWLGNVPAHWEVRPLRTILKQRNEKNNPIETTQILSLSIARGVTLYSHEGRGGNKSKSDLTAYKIARVGDIVLNSMNVIVGAVGLSKYSGAISPVYYALYPRTRNVDIHYYDKVFGNAVFQRYLLIYGKGILIKKSDSGKLNTIRMKISPDDLKGTPLPLPPNNEQVQIARFLNWKTAQIKKTIHNKLRLIALLREQKQAIINQAVTRGIDSNVKLKSSGIFYWGDIPEGWTTRRFKSLSFINSGQVDPRKPEFKELILIAPNHIEKGTGHLLYTETADAQGADSGKYSVKQGQIIYSKIRPHLRKAVISPFDGLCSADMYPITFDPSLLDSEYALLLLLSKPFTKYTEDCSMRVAMPKINREALGTGWFVFPSVREQKTILQFITGETKPIDTAISRAEREIELMNEYRTRLIADVVTGKMDVRDVAIDECADDDFEDLVDSSVIAEEDADEGELCS